MSDTTASVEVTEETPAPVEVTNEVIYERLLGELSENRKELDVMLVDISSTRSIIEKLFPTTVNKTDYKTRFIMEERMKALTGIYGVELSIRKQKESSIKSEVDMRRKLSGEGDNRTLKDLYEDSAALAKAMEQYELMEGEMIGGVEFDGAEQNLDMTPALALKYNKG